MLRTIKKHLEKNSLRNLVLWPILEPGVRKHFQTVGGAKVNQRNRQLGLH